MIGIYLNFNLKSEIYTKLKGIPKKPLIFRNIQSGSAAIVNTAVAGVLSLTMIAIIKSLIPTFVIIIAWLALKEQLKMFELVIMMLTIAGIIVILVDGKETGQDPFDEDEIVWFVILIISSVFTAAGTVAIRKMQRIKEVVIIWYTSWTKLLISVVVVYSFGRGLSICKQFDAGDWAMIALSALSGCVKNICKIKALQLQSASKLQLLDPLQTVIMFVVQIFGFHQPFDKVQYYALAFIFLLYIA